MLCKTAKCWLQSQDENLKIEPGNLNENQVSGRFRSRGLQTEKIGLWNAMKSNDPLLDLLKSKDPRLYKEILMHSTHNP